MVKILLRITALIGVIFFATMAHAQMKDNLRLEIVTALPNNAVSTATAGKRPSQWETPVMQLLFDGKATSPTCGATAIVWFTHMFSETPQGRVYNYFNPAPMDLARFDFQTHRIERTGQKVSVVMNPVNSPGAPTTYFQQITVPLVSDGQGRMGGAVYIPANAIRASANPIMGIAIPGMKLRGLPQGNTSGIRWSTPKNTEFGTINELHKSLNNTNRNDTAVLVGDCEGGRPNG